MKPNVRVQSLTGTDLEAVLDECFVCRAAVAAQYLGAAIAFVAKQRVADMFHVGTNLVCSARFGIHSTKVTYPKRSSTR